MNTDFRTNGHMPKELRPTRDDQREVMRDAAFKVLHGQQGSMLTAIKALDDTQRKLIGLVEHLMKRLDQQGATSPPPMLANRQGPKPMTGVASFLDGASLGPKLVGAHPAAATPPIEDKGDPIYDHRQSVRQSIDMLAFEMKVRTFKVWSAEVVELQGTEAFGPEYAKLRAAEGLMRQNHNRLRDQVTSAKTESELDAINYHVGWPKRD